MLRWKLFPQKALLSVANFSDSLHLQMKILEFQMLLRTFLFSLDLLIGVIALNWKDRA